jgi:hypothetical protein
MSNQAAWIPEAKGQLEVKDASLPKAGKGEVVIKNHAVAVNPVDCSYLRMHEIRSANRRQGKSRTMESSFRNTRTSVGLTSLERCMKSVKTSHTFRRATAC